jgi:hypothetical protein
MSQDNVRQAEPVIGGAGEWIIKNGKFYDPSRKMYILKCTMCKLSHYHKRIDATTCSDRCRMAKSRKNATVAERVDELFR